MNQIAGRISSKKHPPDAADALERLTRFGARGGLIAMVAGLAVSFFGLGYAVVYWRHADMDFMVIYNALLLNDGKAQQFFDHPAYLTILSIKTWFRALHMLGLLDAYSLSNIPPATNVAAFDTAMTHAVRAARLVAWLTATSFVLIFAALVNRIARDWRVASLATFAFAFSGGIAVHVRILRSELIAACFVTFAFMLLIIIGRRASVGRPLLMVIAAALCVLGLENKVHAILLIAALPVLALPFGSPAGSSSNFWRRPTGWLAAAVVGIIAIFSIWMAFPIIATGLDPANIRATSLVPPVFGRPGLYQSGLLLWITVGVIVYAMVWRISAAETFASVFALATGAALALLALDLSFNANVVVAVINPLEKMLNFADAATTDATGHGLAGIVTLIFQGVLQVLAKLTFVLSPSPRPTVFLTWLIIPGIVYAWRRGERQTAIQALLLLLAAIGIDALGIRRGLKSEYFIFTDPLIILAGVVLLERMADLRWQQWAYPVGAVLVTLHVIMSQTEPVRYVLKKSGPEGVCEWNANFLPLLPVPWCSNPPHA
jgi:hypothetical protein